MRLLGRPDVGVALRMSTDYPAMPFHPPELFPEFENSWLGAGPRDPENHVYSLVREALFRHLGGYDPDTKRIDLAALRDIGNIKKIVIKPNWVCPQSGSGQCVTTHGSVLRPILDYLLLAFGDTSELTVADIPLQSSDLVKVWEETGVHALQSYYQRMGLPVRFLDLRQERAITDSSGFISRRERLPGDPLGYVEVTLGNDSYLEAITDSQSVFSVNDYEPGTATCFHRPGRHSYLIPKTVLSADLFVNVPKLKTHCKAGLTVCMKNLVGINGEKGWIPHFRLGAPHSGGDEYPDHIRHVMGVKSRVRNFLQERHRGAYQIAQKVWKTYKQQRERLSGASLTSGGAWSGNDTLWRSILDLVKVITFADENGKLMDTPQRHHLCVVDGIVCGEGEGPLKPSPKPAGLILCASNPVAADWAACHVAGFTWNSIPQLYHARDLHRLAPGFPANPEELTASWRNADPEPCRIRELPMFPLKPASGWKELAEAPQTVSVSSSCGSTQRKSTDVYNAHSRRNQPLSNS